MRGRRVGVSKRGNKESGGFVDAYNDLHTNRSNFPNCMLIWTGRPARRKKRS